MLDLESEVLRGPGSIPTGGNIFQCTFFFSHGNASAANIGIIAVLVNFEKTLLIPTYLTWSCYGFSMGNVWHFSKIP